MKSWTGNSSLPLGSFLGLLISKDFYAANDSTHALIDHVAAHDVVANRKESLAANARRGIAVKWSGRRG